jgi:hypothetical protein
MSDIKGVKPFNRYLFAVRNFLAIGKHEKIKSRMAANGKVQNLEVIPDHSSSTIAIHSIFTYLTIAAYSKLKIAMIDIKVAFIQL